jgi:polyhydroxyalkanoate synthase subunit PhaC
VTTVTPTSFDTDKGLLHLWMKMIDADTMVNTFGNIPGDLLNLGFLMLNPARLVVDKYFGFLKNIEDRRFVENFIRMEKWIFDSPDVPGETFREFIRDCYQRNRLIRSRMNVGGRRVDLDRIRAPLLNFYGRYDHLVPPSACDKLCAAVGSEDTTDICLDTGHIGIYVSSKRQAAFAPKIIQWLEERDRREEQEADIKVTVIRSRAAKRSRRNQTDTPSQPYVADSPEATGTTGQPV